MKFKKLWLILPLLALMVPTMAGCGGNPTLDVVNKFIAAEDLMFSTGDGSGLMAVEDENIVIHMMAFGDTQRERSSCNCHPGNSGRGCQPYHSYVVGNNRHG